MYLYHNVVEYIFQSQCLLLNIIGQKIRPENWHGLAVPQGTAVRLGSWGTAVLALSLNPEKKIPARVYFSLSSNTARGGRALWHGRATSWPAQKKNSIAIQTTTPTEQCWLVPH